jgi:hypothetical protein
MINRLKRFSRGGWITFGIVVGAIIAPGVAIAAFSDIRIVGWDGQTAAHVTPARQLRVVEMDPSRIRRFSDRTVEDGGGCVSVDVPSGNSLMLKQIQVDVRFNPSPGTTSNLAFYADKTCNSVITSVTPNSTFPLTIPLDPGIAIRSGSGFSARAGGGTLVAFVTWFGYTMPVSSVSATTPSL